MTSRPRPPDESRLLQLVYYGYVAASAVARALPEKAAYRTAYYLGSVAAKRSKQRHQVARNLARVTGYSVGSREIDELVEEAFRSYARYWFETFRLVRADKEFFLERTVTVGGDKLIKAAASGGGIAVVSHLGNYDAAGAWAGAEGVKVVTVAEVLRPRRMFDFFVKHRSRLGMTIHPAQPGVTDRLAAAARDDAIVAIVGDRDLKGTGEEVEFFGEPATFPRGPAVVALKSGAPLMVVGVYNTQLEDGKPGWVVDVGDPLDIPTEHTEENVAAITRMVARELEGFVARSPADWHVFQPFWKADRAGR
ncbi:MAG TPA: phosphatidylinositol mannoside acyltransferase [Actinomycetota bacterium]|nr:phosphatidylinositol mannoside acyltransferase [Actinomycetota bacterium]